MRTVMPFIAAISLAASLPLAGGCVSPDSASPAPATSLLELPLTQTGSHGELFRLTSATFDISGGGGFFQTVTSGTESSILLAVPPGLMSILLRDGWRLEKSLDSGASFQQVDAVLGTFNPFALRILASQPAIAEFDFLVRDVNGTLEIRLGVVTQPRELAGGVVASAATDGLAAYARARMDFAVFFDLAQLDHLTGADGSKTLAYTAGAAALELYNDPAGTLTTALGQGQTGGFLSYFVTARPDGTVDLEGSMSQGNVNVNFGLHAIDLPPAIGPDGFPVDEFFFDSTLPFTLDSFDPAGTVTGVLRLRQLVP